MIICPCHCYSCALYDTIRDPAREVIYSWCTFKYSLWKIEGCNSFEPLRGWDATFTHWGRYVFLSFSGICNSICYALHRQSCSKCAPPSCFLKFHVDVPLIYLIDDLDVRACLCVHRYPTTTNASCQSDVMLVAFTRESNAALGVSLILNTQTNSLRVVWASKWRHHRRPFARPIRYTDGCVFSEA